MFFFKLISDHWVILTLFSGAFLVLYTSLFYIELWNPRKKKHEGENETYETRYLSTWKGIPWTVKVLVFFLVIYTIVYSLYAIIHPKSW